METSNQTLSLASKRLHAAKNVHARLKKKTKKNSAGGDQITTRVSLSGSHVRRVSRRLETLWSAVETSRLSVYLQRFGDLILQIRNAEISCKRASQLGHCEAAPLSSRDGPRKKGHRVQHRPAARHFIRL